MFILYTTQGPLVFVHVPKTGGSSVELGLKAIAEHLQLKYLLTYGYEDSRDTSHIPLKLFLKENNLPDNCTYFTCVRNPYDRLYSAYQWYFRGLNPYIKIEESFPEFVKKRLQIWLTPIIKSFRYLGTIDLGSIHVIPEYLFFLNKPLDNSRIIRQEELLYKVSESDEKIKAIFKQHDIPVEYASEIGAIKDNCLAGDPPKEGEYLRHYDDEMINIVNNLYREDFIMFGYNMIEKKIEEKKIEKPLQNSPSPKNTETPANLKYSPRYRKYSRTLKK